MASNCCSGVSCINKPNRGIESFQTAIKAYYFLVEYHVINTSCYYYLSGKIATILPLSNKGLHFNQNKKVSFVME